MSDTDTGRPTRGQVDAALCWADVNGRVGTRHLAAWLLAAEVRALRSELEQSDTDTGRPTREQVDATLRTAYDAGRAAMEALPDTALDQAGAWEPALEALADLASVLEPPHDEVASAIVAALAARTPQPAEPAECPSCDGTEWACYACQTPHEGWLYEAPRAPLPAVPDGEDRVDEVCSWLHERAESTPGPDGAMFARTLTVLQAALDAAPDWEDVPARLDAAAEVLNSLVPMSCAGGDLGRIAVALRLMPAEVRAAVAAALARPTEREK